MIKKTIIALLIFITIGFSYREKNKNEIIWNEKLPNDGVQTLQAGDLGEYKIDTRFNLCFLKSGPYTQVVEIPCKALNGI